MGFNVITGLVSHFDYDLYLQALNETVVGDVLNTEYSVSYTQIVTV
jgi:hypothetical protein